MFPLLKVKEGSLSFSSSMVHCGVIGGFVSGDHHLSRGALVTPLAACVTFASFIVFAFELSLEKGV